MPKISIIIPTYNRSDLLKNAVRSVISQSFEDWELIIVDDGSVDDTKEIAHAFAKSDARISYFYQENAGQAVARNKGAELSTGKYLAFLDSDDVYLSDNLQKKIILLEAHSNILIINGFSWVVDYAGKKFVDYASYAPSNWLVKREFFKAGGGFDPKERNIEDTGIRIRAMNAFNNPDIEYVIREPLTIYFLHGSQVSRAANKEPEIFAKRVEILLGDLDINKDKVYGKFSSVLFSRLANFYSLSGRLKEGRDFFKKSLNVHFSIFTFMLFPATYGGMRIYCAWESFLRAIQKKILWKVRLIVAKGHYRESFTKTTKILEAIKNENSSSK
jgi:glycosyltransferase involved in cell wall biosynthesis